MMMTGDFEERIRSWRAIVASAPHLEGRLKVFAKAAADIAGCTARGLELGDAADALQDIAEANGLVERFGADEIQRITGNAFDNVEHVPDLLELPAPKPKPNGKHHGGGIEPIAASNPLPIDDTKLPGRPWKVPSLLLSGHVTILVAPPGSGKSLLTLQIALLCGSGMRSWGGWYPRGCFRTLIINIEEDETEMQRRLFGAMAKMGINQADMGDRLVLARADSIVVAKADSRTKTVTATPMLERIVATIIALRIDIVVVDPFAETFEGDENSNSELKWAAVLWRQVARRTGCSVLLVHHAKKYSGGMAGDPDAGRGGGALTGVARIVATLFTMTQEEADGFKISAEERLRYLRFDDAKGNYFSLTAARWFRKETMLLNNATETTPGDEVGVLVPWRAPDLFADMDISVVHQILDEIEIGVRGENGEPTGDPYVETKRGANWVGEVVRRFAQCDEKQAKRVLAKWLENKVLEVKQQATSKSKGKLRDCVFVNSANRPGRVEEAAS